ncbi:MAG: OmpH family outer membrane protein, partial [Deltaproteobacteria bacterium]|nr:OmpH family outer membrane protein [Deltaproteobacteria bacterium]
IVVEASRPQTPVKIGYVDISKIAGDSAPGKAANAKLKEKTEKYRSQIAARQKKLESMKKDIEAQLPALTPQQRQAKVKELEKKVGEYQKFVQDAEKEMRKMENELSESMLKAIQKAADEYGKANGFAAIVPKRDLLYLGEKVDVVDVTEEIVKGIR